MRRWTIVAAGLLTAFSGVAVAGEVNTAIVNADRYLMVELGGVNQNYKETNGGAVLDKEQGTLPDIGVEYSVLGLERPFRFVLGGTYAGGQTSYVGQLMNGTPYNSSTRNRILDAHVGVGFAFGLGPLALIPGVMYGEHSWQRDLNYGASPPGYEEHYGNQYMAATLEAQVALNDSTVVSLSGAYGTSINSTMTSTLTPGAIYTLTNKPWIRAGFGVDYAAYRDLHVGVKLSYTQFKYGSSVNSYSGLMEPFSKSDQAVFNLTMGYNF